ncbi:MAG: NitT/TauT family transport system ATP-binding protein [Thermoplasmata archaeon]|jgi:NitT/TauT family transport system ATP-binding protein|nr:NitT/TauT family transport system ATP-binding protein [Thermoplasmata archaeon]
MLSPQLPNVPVGSIVGVLEIVDDYKGKVDAARIAADYDLDIDEFLPSVHAAELLGFVKVAEGDVALTDVGRKMLKASLKTRKTIFREQALKTPIFMDVLGKLQKVGGRMQKDELADILGFKLWTHDQEEAVRTLINWGRHGNILSYDADTKEIVLL